MPRDRWPEQKRACPLLFKSPQRTAKKLISPGKRIVCSSVPNPLFIARVTFSRDLIALVVDRVRLIDDGVLLSSAHSIVLLDCAHVSHTSYFCPSLRAIR